MPDPVESVSNAASTLTSSENIAIAALCVVSAVFLGMIVVLWRDGNKAKQALHDIQVKTLESLQQLKEVILLRGRD